LQVWQTPVNTGRKGQRIRERRTGSMVSKQWIKETRKYFLDFLISIRKLSDSSNAYATGDGFVTVAVTTDKN